MFIRFLSACRFLLAVPVLGCVLLTAGVVAVGFARIVGVTGEVLSAGDYSQAAAKSMALAVIEIIDLFLIGTSPTSLPWGSTSSSSARAR